MKLTRFVKFQLVAFSILTVVGLIVMGGTYVGLPNMLFGIGHYEVTVKLAATGGLYEHANVAYRGLNVGKVKEVRLTPEGVDAKLSIDSDYKIPADVDAWVRSVSAIGEQYVDLKPVDDPQGGNLSDGSVIPVDRTQLPQDVGTLLDQTDRLLSSVADTRLRLVIDEAFKAFDGAGPELARLIDSASLLVQEAKDNTQVTKDLIDQIGPLLDTQIESDQAMRTWTSSLATVTDQLREHDPALRSVLNNAPGALSKASQLFQDLQPTLPLLARNLVSVGQVAVTYNAGIEQLMVVYPPLVAALLTAAKTSPEEYGVRVDFMVSLNDPPGCTLGFLPPEQRRGPDEWRGEVPDTPSGMYCKTPVDSKEEVRGLRNIPCMEVPGKRAPTPELCRDPEGYVPAGVNSAAVAPRSDAVTGGAAPANNQQPASGQPDTQPAGVTTRTYDPKNGTYVGPDGLLYRQADIAKDGSGTVPVNWQSMLQEQQK
ncbi:MlaD family protein [Nocardia sp. NPDC005978]|uniref:MlaD family protein n=1 Tax=Nocardia sp. NPDC005978 TaxID=3156725 RepID=UPI0033A186B3